MSDDLLTRLSRIGERVSIPCPDNIRGCLVFHYRVDTDPACVEAIDEIKRLRSALSATLIVAEKLCEALDVDMSETSFRVKVEKSGEILGRVSLADILQSGRDALGEEKK